MLAGRLANNALTLLAMIVVPVQVVSVVTVSIS